MLDFRMQPEEKCHRGTRELLAGSALAQQELSPSTATTQRRAPLHRLHREQTPGNTGHEMIRRAEYWGTGQQDPFPGLKKVPDFHHSFS